MEKSITTKLTERELNILISKVAKGTSEENLENPEILVSRLFDKLGKLRSDLRIENKRQNKVKYILNGFEENLNYILNSTDAVEVARKGSKENGDLVIYFETN